jgi:hypothetical protein
VDLLDDVKVYKIELQNIITPKTDLDYYGSAQLLNEEGGVILEVVSIPLLEREDGVSLEFIDLSLRSKFFNNPGNVGEFRF